LFLLGSWSRRSHAIVVVIFFSDSFRVVLDNPLGGHRETTGRQVPACLFTDPELARAGLA
jgi:hypothetical protein